MQQNGATYILHPSTDILQLMTSLRHVDTQMPSLTHSVDLLKFVGLQALMT